MIQWRGAAPSRPYVEPGVSQSDAAMLMDVGHRLLGSLRHIDSRRWTFSSTAPQTFLLTAHFNTHRVDAGISSRCCWHGSQRVVSDEKLAKVFGAILKFGAAFRSWRSWVLGSEQLAGRSSSYRLVVFASTEAWDVQGVSKIDQVTLAQMDENKPILLDVQNCGEMSSLGKPSNQIANLESSNINALAHTNHGVDKDSSSGFNDGLSPKSELLANLVVIVFDIETTGFKLSDDRIIEFAARDLAGGDCSTIQTLVNPERPIPLYASNVHGIHSDMVNKSEIPRWKDVAPVIIQYMESRRNSGGPIFLVAHNGKRFDVPFLMKEFERCSLQMPSWWQFVDSVPIAREAMKAKGGKLPLKLSALYEYYKLPFLGQAHRALTDVHMLASVLQMLMADLKMPVSEFVKKSFTTKDILGSSASSSDNLESLSQDLDMSSDFYMEDEEVMEGSCAPHEANEELFIPWDDDQLERPHGDSLMCNSPDRSHKESVCLLEELEAKSKAQTTLDIKNNELHVVNETSSISGNILTTLGPVYDCNISYHLLKSDNVDLAQRTPMLKQYMQVKSQRPALLLLWKAGDFYQTFFEDAKKVSEVCNVALSAIKGGEFLDGLVPMASLHLRQVDVHIQAMLAAGVPVCKQDQAHRMEHDTSSQVHLSTILTHGTIRIDRMRHGSSGHRILAFVPSHTKDGTWGVAYADIAAGEINATEGQGQSSMLEEIFALHPSEIIYSANGSSKSINLLPSDLAPGFRYSSRPSSEFCLTFFKKKLQDIFGVDSSEDTGLGTLPVAACAAGGLLGYIEDIQCSSGVKLPFHKIASYFPPDFMLLDQDTRICLEVFKTKRQGQFEGSLLWALDHTKTAMGKRLLKKWLFRPLLDKELICARLNAVEVFVNNSKLRQQVRHDLSLFNDLERLSEDIVLNRSSPWGLLAMGQSLSILQTLLAKVKGGLNPYFSALENEKALLDLGQKIQDSFEMEASLILEDSQILKDNIDPTLDALRSEIRSLDFYIKDLEKLEQDRTKISSLEIVKNEKGDHFVKVKKCALTDMPIPDNFWLCASEISEHEEFFVTASLLEHNKKRLEVITKARLREAEILQSLRDEVLQMFKKLQAASQAIAAIDVLATLAEVGASRDYCKPVIIEDSREITIMGGRHPVVELLKPELKFFNANSLYMGYQSKIDKKNQQKSALYSELDELSGFLPEECWPRPDILILTGPPASGKSCYLRQAGIIQLLAQIGSYVPAEEAILSVADAIFMKMDDCDDISTGQSCFELDMKRCVNILRNATSQSLILLDGVARVASSHDDVAIIRAIVEFLAQNVKARTLITTQNSSLGSLEDDFPNIANFQCMNNVDSMFSYCVKPGFCFESSVAALNKIEGFPEWIANRAGQLICKEDITEEEAFQLEQQSHDNNIVGQESLQPKQDSFNSETTDEQHFQLDDIAMHHEWQLPADIITGEESVQPEKQLLVEPSGPEILLTGTKLQNLDSSADHKIEMDAIVSNHICSEGFSDTTLESSDSPGGHKLLDSDLRGKTWKKVLLVLQDYPATHALAKQKGFLVSVKKSPEASQVHISTSALFLKKFLQHEHATALENAFLRVLQSPIQLKLTVAIERET